MTTPTPYTPGPAPAPYTGAPAGILRPSPMGLGDVFSGVIELYKRRWPLFVGIALIPAAALAVTLIIYILAMIGVVAGVASSRGNPDPFQLVGAMIGGFVLYLVAILFIVALQYKCYGMISLGAVDLVNGSQPTLGSLNQRTRGLGWRVLGVMFAIGAAVAVVWGIVGAIMAATIAAPRSGRSPSGAEAGGAVLLLVLLSIALMVAAIFLSVRWLYFVPVLAIEGAGGFAALRRSWALTAGSFWRTLGYYIVASLVVAVPSIIVSLIGSAFTNSRRATVDPAAIMIPMLVIGLLSIAISVFTGPFMQLFTTVMYLDQVNRGSGAATTPSWNGQQPAWDAQQPAVAPPAWGPAPGVTPGAPAPMAYDPNANPYVAPAAPAAPPAQPEVPDLEATRRRSDLVPPPAWTPPQQAQPPQPPQAQPPQANPWARPTDPGPEGQGSVS